MPKSKNNRKNKKRRKQYKPTVYKPQITIGISEVTGNFLVMVDGFCFDSAIKRSDAERQVGQLEKLFRKFPIEKNFNEHDFVEWMRKYSASVEPCEAVAIDNKGQRRVIDGSESDSILIPIISFEASA